MIYVGVIDLVIFLVCFEINIICKFVFLGLFVCKNGIGGDFVVVFCGKCDRIY